MWSVRLYDVDYGNGRWLDGGDGVELCRDCADHHPEEIRLRLAGPDPHGGPCDVCERDGYVV